MLATAQTSTVEQIVPNASLVTLLILLPMKGHPGMALPPNPILQSLAAQRRPPIPFGEARDMGPPQGGGSPLALLLAALGHQPPMPLPDGAQRASNFPSGEDRAGLLAHLANMRTPGWEGDFGRQPIFHGNNITHAAHLLPAGEEHRFAAGMHEKPIPGAHRIHAPIIGPEPEGVRGTPYTPPTRRFSRIADALRGQGGGF